MTVVQNWSDPVVAERILRSYRTWAVVGCSSRPWRASHGVSRYLLRQGYRVVPVHPNEKEVHGLRAYRDLRSIPASEGPIEVVDLFRNSNAVLPHVEEAIEVGAKAVWMQLDVWNEEAATRAAEAGLLVVMDRCPAIDHPAMGIEQRWERIRQARPEEAEELTALAHRSKAHWGYGDDFMARAVDAIVINADVIGAHEVWVLESDAGAPLGVYRVIPGEPAFLEDLWIEPSEIGRGRGRELWSHALATARRLGAQALELDADPNARAFYERMGARQVGETPSRIEDGLLLPRMRVELT